MDFINGIFDKLKRHPKRIVFPEGTDPRVLQAAERFVKLRLGAPILLGKRDAIEKVALAEKVDLDHVAIIDPETSSELPDFCARLEKLDRYRRLNIKDSSQIMVQPNYFAAMMLQYGEVDGLVGGARDYSSALLRPLLQLIAPLPHVNLVSSCMIMELDNRKFGENGVLFFADCAVVPEPDVEQLATIAVQTGKLCRQLIDGRPRVALLSFSTKGSTILPATQKVSAATALARQRAQIEGIEMEIDGELQADTAIAMSVAERKLPTSQVAGRANVLIFPELNSANISSKLVEHLTGGRTYGQILVGLSKPAADVPRAASAENILGVAAIIGLQAIEYRKLYPPVDPDVMTGR